MGQRIAFYQICEKDTSIQQLLEKHYTTFCKWWIKEVQPYKKDFDEEDAILDTFISANKILPDDFYQRDYPVEKNLITTLISEDYFPESALQLIGPLISRSNYAISSNLVHETQNPEFIRLWNYIINGRKLNGESIIQAEEIRTCSGYLTPHEIQLLKNYIAHYFGNSAQMKEAYNLPELLNKRLYSQTTTVNGITNNYRYERISMGLECIADLIESKLHHSTSDLIIFIDGIDRS
jgi:hypothetical protein